MRAAMTLALFLLCSCAGEKLASSPPSSVNFSGAWHLNVDDSDDPSRLIQNQADKVTKASTGPSQGGQGGRGGRGGSTAGVPATLFAPVLPPLSALGSALHWPGHELEIHQTGGVVSMLSGGAQQTFRPLLKAAAGRNLPGRERDDLPSACGWDGDTLVVQRAAQDDDAGSLEQRFSISSGGQRLIEVITFKSGRSAGFTLSRAWDRVSTP